jgi:hypothetical protein
MPPPLSEIHKSVAIRHKGEIMQETDKYDDIINLPCPEPKNRARMSSHDRAAQFSPFAALTGYGEQIKETSRLTLAKPNITEEKMDEISNILNIVVDSCYKYNLCKITHFEKDNFKDGGRLITASVNVKKVDSENQNIILSDGCSICINDIIDISPENF